jgi:integrase
VSINKVTTNNSILLPDDGICMRGKVRTWEKCPQCGRKFSITEEYLIHCPDCKTKPKLYYITLYWDKKQHKIYRDTDGHLLDSYQRAHRLLESMRKEIDDGLLSISNYIPKEIEQFRGYRLLETWHKGKIARDLSPGHLKKLRQYIDKYFLPFFNKEDCRKIRTYHVENFLLSIPSHLSLKTKRNIMIMLHNFCDWLFRREIIARIPSFPSLSPPEPPIYWIDKDTQLHIISFIPELHRPVFEFLAYHPVRPGEARALKVVDCNLKDFTIHICRAWSLNELRSRKNKKPYYLPLNHTFIDKYRNIFKDKLPEAFLFTNTYGKPYTDGRLRKIWNRACRKAGIKISLYHATRHSIASQAVEKGVPMELIQKALDHTSSKTTKRYASIGVHKLRGIVE